MYCPACGKPHVPTTPVLCGIDRVLIACDECGNSNLVINLHLSQKRPEEVTDVHHQ